MSDKSNPAYQQAEKSWVALDYATEFGQRMAVYLSCFALLEGYPPKMVAALTGLSRQDSEIILGSFQSQSARVDLWQMLLAERDMGDPVSAAHKTFISGFRAHLAIRNKYAHAEYGLAGDVVVRRSFTTDSRRATIETNMLVEDVNRDIDAIKFLMAQFHGFIYRNGELPKPLRGPPPRVGRLSAPPPSGLRGKSRRGSR